MLAGSAGGAAAALANFDEDQSGDGMELPRMESVARESVADLDTGYKPTIDTTKETFEGSDEDDSSGFFESEGRAGPTHGSGRAAEDHDHDHDFSSHNAFDIAMETDHKNEDGTVFRPASFRQAMYLFLDEPGSTAGATAWSMLILLLICASSFSFVFETHPYFECTYSSAVASECSGGGDPTSEEACTRGQSQVQRVDAATGAIVSGLVNNTYTPGQEEIGLYAQCLAHSNSSEYCLGTLEWYENEPKEGIGAGASCTWNAAVNQCEFIGLDTEDCTQWEHPFSVPVPPLARMVATPSDAKQWRRKFRSAEVVAILIFTVDYLLRLATCTSRPFVDHGFRSYAASMQNVIDLLAVLPFYFEFFIPKSPSSLGVVRILRLARIFRVFKAGSVLKELRYVATHCRTCAAGCQQTARNACLRPSPV